MLQYSQKQQKIVSKTSLLWSLTSKKAEICASYLFSGQYLKSKLF